MLWYSVWVMMWLWDSVWVMMWLWDSEWVMMWYGILIVLYCFNKEFYLIMFKSLNFRNRFLKFIEKYYNYVIVYLLKILNLW